MISCLTASHAFPIGHEGMAETFGCIKEKCMRYKIFTRRAGLRVSELALGAGNFGTRWGDGAEREEVAGGNTELLEVPVIPAA
jgi:hypothetical protein